MFDWFSIENKVYSSSSSDDWREIFMKEFCKITFRWINFWPLCIYSYSFFILGRSGQSLAKALIEASKILNIKEPHINKPSDTNEETRIKNIIVQMLQFEPSSRITAAQVLRQLIQLKANMGKSAANWCKFYQTMTALQANRR